MERWRVTILYWADLQRIESSISIILVFPSPFSSFSHKHCQLKRRRREEVRRKKRGRGKRSHREEGGGGKRERKEVIERREGGRREKGEEERRREGTGRRREVKKGKREGGGIRKENIQRRGKGRKKWLGQITRICSRRKRRKDQWYWRRKGQW